MDLRKTNDLHFFNEAIKVSNLSNCFSRKIGAIIVKNDEIISSGYNGPPSNIKGCVPSRYYNDYVLKMEIFIHQHITGEISTDDVCPRKYLGFNSGDGYERCPAIHAETRSILNSIKNNIDINKAVMYVTCGVPCFRCLTEIVEMGISEVVVIDVEKYNHISRYLIEQSGLKIRKYSFMKSEV